MKPALAGDLRGIVVDRDELAKGARLFDEHGLLNLARHENKLFAEAKGSGPVPYRVSLSFGEGALDVRAHCTCPAALSRDLCKHAAALLVAWARAPEAFVESGGPVRARAKKRPKRGEAAPAELMKKGVRQVLTLVRELAILGIATITTDRVQAVEALGENLRAYDLRRLGAKTLELAELLAEVTRSREALPALAYAELCSDLLLTARKLERHLVGGEPLDERHVEELVGKTWQKADRAPIAGLDLVEYAYLTRVTSDEFVVRESRLFDLGSGAHYGEKQIVPGFLARRTDPKPSRGGAVLAGVRGATYPGYPPTRLEIADLGERRPIDEEALGRLLDHALPDVGAAIAALVDRRRDVFAPELLAAAVRVDALVSRAGRLEAVDANGLALHLPEDPAVEEWLGEALHGARLRALLGDVGLDAALPMLWPLAAVIEHPASATLELRTLFTPGDHGKSATPASDAPRGLRAWTATARAAGVSAGAIALVEVREQLADAYALGLGALGPRVTEPLAERIAELGLAEPAALLHAIGERDPAARLEDFVKLFRVLGIALARAASGTRVERASLVQVPTYESVFVAPPPRWLGPEEVDAARASGAMDRYEAAVHLAHHYESLPLEALAAGIGTTWSDGSASSYVARAFAGKREEGVAAARRALAGEGGRVAKITAIGVLAAVGGLDAEGVLHELATGEGDAGLRAIAREALDAITRSTPGGEAVRGRQAATRARVQDAAEVLATASTKDARVRAVQALAALGDSSALPALRRALHVDPAHDVRREAALALALLGDTDTVPPLVAMLARRGEGERDAALAAEALGRLGDVRGLPALLDAWAEGYEPSVIGEALAALGPLAIAPILARIEADPTIAERRGAVAALAHLPDRKIAATLRARARRRAG